VGLNAGRGQKRGPQTKPRLVPGKADHLSRSRREKEPGSHKESRGREPSKNRSRKPPPKSGLRTRAESFTNRARNSKKNTRERTSCDRGNTGEYRRIQPQQNQSLAIRGTDPETVRGGHETRQKKCPGATERGRRCRGATGECCRKTRR